MPKQTDQQPIKITIKGAYGFYNFGDDALLFAVDSILKSIFQNSINTYICNDSSYIDRILTKANTINRKYANTPYTDIFVYGGGTQFFSFPLTLKKNQLSLAKKILIYIKDPYSLLQNIKYKLTSSFKSQPFPQKVIALGIGIGPFVKNCKRIPRTKKHFSSMNFVAVRDTYSYNLCKSWNCKNMILSADLCYFPGLWENIPSPTNHTNKNIQKIGIIIRDWPHTQEGESYAMPLFSVVDELRSNNIEVVFISFAKRYDNNWIASLKKRNEQCICWDPLEQRIQDFLDLLNDFDVFISARYHGAIFASILKKPVICIEIEQKLALVAQLLGKSAKLWGDPFNIPQCLNYIKELEDDYLIATTNLKKVVEEQGELVEQMLSTLKKMPLYTTLLQKKK